MLAECAQEKAHGETCTANRILTNENYLVPLPESNILFSISAGTQEASIPLFLERDSFPLVESLKKHKIIYWKRH